MSRQDFEDWLVKRYEQMGQDAPCEDLEKWLEQVACHKEKYSLGQELETARYRAQTRVNRLKNEKQQTKDIKELTILGILIQILFALWRYNL